ncbi:MAG: hypothetical protein WA364_04880 [Candidatus Nitrosopolaris sp.]
MNLTTTLIVALIAASLSTVAYAQQQALAWGGGFAGFGFGGLIVEKINQENICAKAICINQAENRANGFGFGP